MRMRTKRSHDFSPFGGIRRRSLTVGLTDLARALERVAFSFAIGVMDSSSENESGSEGETFEPATPEIPLCDRGSAVRVSPSSNSSTHASMK